MKRLAFIAAAMLCSTSANAQLSTFATFVPTSNASNVRWVNDGASKTTALSSTSTGSGSYFYTTAIASSNSPGASLVNFYFLQSQLAATGPVSAHFFMDLRVLNTPATASGSFRLQDIPDGSFSFRSTGAFTANNTLYSADSNLLTGVFTAGNIIGSGSSGSFSGNTNSGSLIYTSDIIDFSQTIGGDFSMSLSRITPTVFQNTQSDSLRTFRANVGGNFSSDPAPIVSAVPEPATWAMMLIGFAGIGCSMRAAKRKTKVSYATA